MLYQQICFGNSALKRAIETCLRVYSYKNKNYNHNLIIFLSHTTYLRTYNKTSSNQSLTPHMHATKLGFVHVSSQTASDSTYACNQTRLRACIQPGQRQPGSLELAWLGREVVGKRRELNRHRPIESMCVSYKELQLAHHELKPLDIREKSHCIIEMILIW